MWQKTYQDYKEDDPLKKEQVQPGEGITGCEMHDINGWGLTHHEPKPTKPGAIRSLLRRLFGGK